MGGRGPGARRALGHGGAAVHGGTAEPRAARWEPAEGGAGPGRAGREVARGGRRQLVRPRASNCFMRSSTLSAVGPYISSTIAPSARKITRSA